MRFTVLTLFPEMFHGVLAASILGKATAAGLLDVELVDIRDFATDRHRVVDDVPYGGGDGMVMKPEPLVAAIEHVRETRSPDGVFVLSPQGRVFSRAVARELVGFSSIALVCGRYEGVDERVMDFVDGELSIGDYVLSGGEPAAIVVIDAIARLIPGVLGNQKSIEEESFEDGLLEYPQYTRPRVFRDRAVPTVLLSGNHGLIARWRRQQSLLRTRVRRSDLLMSVELTEEDRQLLREAVSGGE